MAKKLNTEKAKDRFAALANTVQKEQEAVRAPKGRQGF